MKKTVLLLALSISGTLLMAQYTAKDVFTKNGLVWFGLDFSKAKMINVFDPSIGAVPSSGAEIKNIFIPKWNAVVLNEPKKYNLENAFHKMAVIKDMEVVERSNAAINADSVLGTTDYTFANAPVTVGNIISTYRKGEVVDGIGVVFIVEYFNKTKLMASVYVTFFDIATKQVLFTEHLLEQPIGFGLRNYWAGAIGRMFKEIDHRSYERWQKKYSK